MTTTIPLPEWAIIPPTHIDDFENRILMARQTQGNEKDMWLNLAWMLCERETAHAHSEAERERTKQKYETERVARVDAIPNKPGQYWYEHTNNIATMLDGLRKGLASLKSMRDAGSQESALTFMKDYNANIIINLYSRFGADWPSKVDATEWQDIFEHLDIRINS